MRKKVLKMVQHNNSVTSDNKASLPENDNDNLMNILNIFSSYIQPSFLNLSETFIIPDDSGEIEEDQAAEDQNPRKAAKCDTFDNIIDNVLFYRCVLIPVFICIVCLALSKKRTHKFLNLFKGRPGLIYPVNLMQNQENLLPIVAAFVFLGWVMIEFITNKECASPFYMKERVKQLGPFYALASYIIFGFIFYPIFAALTADSLIGYIVGMIYCWILAPVMIIDGVQRVNERTSFVEIQAMQVAALIPPLICIVYLCLWFPYRLIQRVCYERLKSLQKRDDKIINFASHVIYVKHLFTRHREPKKELTFKQKLLSGYWFYKSVPGFAYSKSIIAAVSMGICFMYMFAVATLKKFYVFLEVYNRLLRRPHAALEMSTKWPTKMLAGFFQISPKELAPILLKEETFWFDVLQSVIYLSVFLAFLAVICALLATMHSYRRHMLQIYSRSQSDIPHFSQLKPQSVVIQGVKYIGYQVAYATWGFGIQMFCLFFFIGIPSFVITAIIRYNFFWDFLEFVWNKVWAGLVVLIILKFTQIIMVRLWFLMKDEHGNFVLAIDNRRLFFNFQYFAIFGNIALGSISTILRIVKGAIAGVICIPRLDVSTINRRFESLDAGHTSYVSMLYLEHVYRNPIMLAFIGILMQSKHLTTKLEVQTSNFTAFITGKKHRPTTYNETAAFRRAKIRWQVALTLINNEELLLMRKKAIKNKKRMEEEELKNKLKESKALKNRLKRKLDLVYGKVKARMATDQV